MQNSNPEWMTALESLTIFKPVTPTTQAPCPPPSNPSANQHYQHTGFELGAI